MTKPVNLADLKANAQAMSGRLRIMSHPERLIMLCRLDEGEASVSELVALTGLSQSAVSQHLARFRDQGIVSARGEAQTRYYSLSDAKKQRIIAALCEACHGHEAA